MARRRCGRSRRTQRRSGWACRSNGYGVGELAAAVAAVSEADVDGLVAVYEEAYELAPALRAGGERRESLRQLRLPRNRL